MDNRRHILTILLIIASLFLSVNGCGQCPPTKRFVQTSLLYSERINQVKSVAVIVDTCMSKDSSILLEESQIIESYMKEATSEFLIGKKYEVNYTLSPFVGAFMKPNMEFQIIKKKGDKPCKERPPFVTCDINEDEEYKEAVKSTFKSVLECISSKRTPPFSTFKNSDNMQKYLSIIAERTKTDYAFIIIGNGAIVPGLESLVQAEITGIATAFASGGLIAVSFYDVSYLDTYIALVDLKNGEMLWFNSLRFKQANFLRRDYYSKLSSDKKIYTGWVREMLYYFPERN